MIVYVGAYYVGRLLHLTLSYRAILHLYPVYCFCGEKLHHCCRLRRYSLH